MQTCHTVTITLLGLSVAFGLTSCNDPEAEALKRFTDQSLTVLQPERSYIAPGGLVLLPDHGHPLYLDPLDDPAANSQDNKNEVDFQAVFADYAKQQHSGLGLAVQLVSSVLPAAGSVNVSHDTDVTLDQINSSGKRLLSGALFSFVNMGNTATELKARLDPHAKQKVRAFVVQEFYATTSMSLKSTTNTGLSVSLSNSQNIPSCASTSGNTTGSGSTSTSATEQPASSATGSAGNGQSSKSATGSTGTSSASKPTGNATTATANNASTGAARPGGSLAICLGPNNYSLSFTSSTPIPFAVRLIELELDGNTITIVANGKPLPGSMASGGAAAASTVIGGGIAQTLVRVCPQTLTEAQCKARARKFI